MAQLYIYNAAYDGKSSEVRRLIREKKGDVNERNDNGWTPIIVAASHGYEKVVQELIKAKANLSATSDKRRTAVYEAAYKQHWHILRVLLRHRAIASIATEDQATALQWAVKRAKPTIVSLLLNNGAQDTISVHESFGGNTALHMAARKDLRWIVRKLLLREAEWSAKNADGDTAHDIAKRKGYTKTTKVLEHIQL